MSTELTHGVVARCYRDGYGQRYGSEFMTSNKVFTSIVVMQGELRE